MIAAVLWVVPASAQHPVDPNEEALPVDALQRPGDIEEIPITGSEAAEQKHLAAPTTAGDLQALRIEDIADLANFTPNLEINTAFAASNPTIFIRGIGLKDYHTNAAGEKSRPRSTYR